MPIEEICSGLTIETLFQQTSLLQAYRKWIENKLNLKEGNFLEKIQKYFNTSSDVRWVEYRSLRCSQLSPSLFYFNWGEVGCKLSGGAVQFSNKQNCFRQNCFLPLLPDFTHQAWMRKLIKHVTNVQTLTFFQIARRTHLHCFCWLLRLGIHNSQ